MHEYIKLYIKNWLTEFENKTELDEGRCRRPMTQEEFEQFFNDCAIEAHELVLSN